MSISNFVLEEAVEQFVLKGYCKVPFNKAVVAQSQKLFTTVLQDLANRGQTESWRLQVPGEAEADLGFIPPRPNKDIKWFFHYNLFLADRLEKMGVELSVKEKLLLEVNQELFLDTYELASQIVTELEFAYGWSVLQSFQDCATTLKPYTTSIMRSLWYQGVELQKGARPHIDRGLFAIHLFDQGGDLIKLDGPDDKVGEVISPGPGEAVVFTGVKSLLPSGGQVGPLWHKSTTVPGKDRRAVVSFWHIDSLDGYQVIDALKARDYFDQVVRPTLVG